MYPVKPICGATPPSQIYGASSRQRCGNDGQRKRVAHMPTATTTKEDSRSKLVQNHPHDFTKKQNLIWRTTKCSYIRFRPPLVQFPLIRGVKEARRVSAGLPLSPGQTGSAVSVIAHDGRSTA